jgi:hypothetical protein
MVFKEIFWNCGDKKNYANFFGKKLKYHHILKKWNHISPSLDNESYMSPKLGMNVKQFFYFVWPIAKFGSFMLWMSTNPPTWHYWKKKHAYNFMDAFSMELWPRSSKKTWS